MVLVDRLMIGIDADGRPATAELDRVGRKVKETLTLGERFARDFLQGLGIGGGVSAGLAAANAVQSIARFLVDAGRAASEDARAQVVLATTLRNTTEATDEQIESTEGWISNLSRAVGVADDELRPALGTLVRSTEDVASAQRLLQLALDVSAGTGRDVVTVATALAKAYEGQTTALGRLVPETIGIVKEGGTLTEVLEDLDRSFGGVAENAALADPFSRLTVEMQEFKETIGTSVLPAVETFNSVLAEGAREWEVWGNAAQTALAPFRALSGIAPINLGLGSSDGTLHRLQAMREALRENATVIAELGERSNFVGGILRGIFGPGLAEIARGGHQAAEDIKSTAASVRDLDDAVNDLFDGIFGLSSAQDRFNSALEEQSSSSSRASSSTRDLVAVEFERERAARNVLAAQLELVDAEKNLEEVRKGASEREKARARLDTVSAQNRIAQANQRIAEATNELNRATGRRGNAQDAARARQALADALLEQERAQQDLIDTQERENDVLNEGKEGSDDLADAVKRVEDAHWSLREAVEAQRQAARVDESDGGPLGRSAAQQRDRFREAAKAASDVIQELINAGAPQDVINEKIGEMVSRLQAAGREAGVTQSEIQKTADLLVALGLINQAENERQIASSYGFGFTTLREGLDSLRRRGFYVPDIAYQLAGGRATGGPMNAGATYRVGERGPEYLTMGNSPGWVTPMSGGSPTFVFNGPVVADRLTLERMLVDALNSAQRNGRN